MPTRLAGVVYVRDKDGDRISCGRNSLVDFWCLCSQARCAARQRRPPAMRAHCRRMRNAAVRHVAAGCRCCTANIIWLALPSSPVHAVFDLYQLKHFFFFTLFIRFLFLNVSVYTSTQREQLLMQSSYNIKNMKNFPIQCNNNAAIIFMKYRFVLSQRYIFPLSYSFGLTNSKDKNI